MSDWVDFAVYAVLLASLWFVQPWTQTKLAIPMLLDRNPAWVAANPAAVQRIEASRWLVWLNFGLGLVFLGVLTTLQLGIGFPTWPAESPPGGRWMLLWDVTILSILVAIVVNGVIGIRSWRALQRAVPVGERRQASLERRSLQDYVPMQLQLLVYALVGISLVAWVAVAITGAHSSPQFWARFVIVFALSAVFEFFVRVAVGRRPHAMDRICGPAFRRGEVRFSFALNLLPPLISIVRLYEEIVDTVLVDLNRAMFLCLAIIVICGLLRTALLVAGAAPLLARRPLAQSGFPAEDAR